MRTLHILLERQGISKTIEGAGILASPDSKEVLRGVEDADPDCFIA